MDEKILVTGSSGTIGTRLCEKLLDENIKLSGVDRKPNKWNQEIDNLTYSIDLCEEKQIQDELPKDIDILVHLAANARVYKLVKQPKLARENFTSLFNILEFARKTDVDRFIFASSREVYGNRDQIFHSEEEAFVKNCESPYTSSKIGGEALVHSYQRCYDIYFSILRFSNVYGMYDDSDRVIPLFIKRAREGKDLIVYGEEKLLDLTYIDDAVNGIIKCIKNREKAKNETFNIASGEGHTILELAQLIKSEVNGDSEIIIESSRTGEVLKFVADISKAERILDYEPKTGFEEGIKKSVEWYLDNLYG